MNARASSHSHPAVHLVIDGGVSAASVGHAAFLLAVVWWAWIYTTWMVNWFDPGSVPVRRS